MPAHVRAEAWVAAAVPDQGSELRVRRHVEAEAIARNVGHRRLVDGPGLEDGPHKAMGLLHLAPRRPAQGMVAFGLAAGGEGVEEPRYPEGEVADRREHAAHRCERPVALHPLRMKLLVDPDVAEREPRRLDVLGTIGGRRHAEWCEDPVAHELAVLLPGGRRDDPTEDPVAEVRVLERGSWRPGERQARRQEALKGVKGEVLLAIAPGVVRREARRHRQQVADRDGWRVRRVRPPARERRHVRIHGVVQPQPTLVTQQDDRGRGERLRHRRDPEHGVGVGPSIVAVADRAGTPAVDEAAVAHDAPGDARDPRFALEPLEAVIECRQQVLEGGQRATPGGGSANTRNVSTSRNPIVS